MITYIDSENRQNYTVLFDKASIKLGLKPIIEEVRNEETHEVEKLYYKRVFENEVWKTVPCFDVDGEGKPVRDSEGKIIFNGIDESSDSLLEDGKPVKPISSLNEYFQHIKELAGLAIGQGRTGSDPYFLRVPLDEPFFEINANTRGITVPGELSQIAVRGDKLAEIVFFKIDRYYDAVDLNTRHIYIEWQLPDGTKGISRDFLRDTQSEKDKIIFGWAIGEELTKQVGAIKFAVRFVEWFDNTALDEHDERIQLDTAQNNTQLLYSFSSLPATVSVVDSLNYSLFEDDEALSLYNSQVTADNIGTIILYLEDSDADVPGESAPESSAIPNFVRDLPVTANLVDGKLELLVEAFADDGGQISYVFGRIAHTDDEGTGVKATGAKGIVAKIKFVEATDMFINGDFNDEKTFYAKDSTGAFIAVSEEDVQVLLDENPNTEFFERVAYVVVQQPGHYYAIADNRAGSKKTASAYSTRLYIPWASKPVVSKQMASKFVAEETKYELDTSDMDEAAFENQNKTNVIVTSQLLTPNTAITLQPDVSADSPTYVWYKNANNHLMNGGVVANAESYTRPDGLTDEEWADQEAAILEAAGWEVIEGATDATYTAAEPGCYAVKVVNAFNNSVTQTNLLDAGACRVTNMPEIPSINWAKFKEESRVSIPTEIEISEAARDITKSFDYDRVSYQWHKVTKNNNVDTEEATAEDILNPTREITFVDGKASIPFVPLTAGVYFLTVTNELNDASVIYNSAEDPDMGTIVITTTA